jgi:hypothetical protein
VKSADLPVVVAVVVDAIFADPADENSSIIYRMARLPAGPFLRTLVLPITRPFL